MKGKKEQTNQPIHRRRFVSNTVKVIALGSLLAPLAEACNNKKSSKPVSPGSDTTKSRTTQRGAKKIRKKWSHERLVINTKTNVLHFPTSKVYHYYDEIKHNHLQEISLASWATQLQEPARLNREQSGNIVEILTLQHLAGAIDDTSLIVAIDTLSTAFRNEYEKVNSMNFRLHELMLQLVALNNTIPADQKWMTFNTKVKKPEQLRKRQQWMNSETNFSDRINYILQRRNDYISRLNKRAAKYSFT